MWCLLELVVVMSVAFEQCLEPVLEQGIRSAIVVRCALGTRSGRQMSNSHSTPKRQPDWSGRGREG